MQMAPASYAAYSANLVLLILLVAEAEASSTGELGCSKVPVSELSTLGTAPVSRRGEINSFQAVTRLWYAQLSPSEWSSLLGVVRVCFVRQKSEEGSKEEPRLEICRWSHRDFHRPIKGYEILYGYSTRSVLQKGRIRLDSLAGHAFREASLLDDLAYKGVCETLLPYVSTVGSNFDADQFQIGQKSSAILALLIPDSHIPANRRPSLYIELFKSDLTLPVARLLLSRLYNEAQFLSPRSLARVVISTARYAWANINVYLDLITQVVDVIKVHELQILLGRILGGLRTSGTSVLNLAGLHDSSDLHGLEIIINPIDLLAMIGLRELLGLPESYDLRKLYYLLDLPTLDEQRRRPSRDSDYRVLRVVLWTSMIQRKLPAPDLPPSLSRDDVRRLEASVPDFITRNRQLAARHGCPDLFPTDGTDALPEPG